MYYAFFGLKQPPFRITPDTDFFFEGGNRGAVLEAEEVERQIELYRTRSAEQRREIVGLQPKRAEVILAGACIVRTVLDKLGRDSLTASDRGLRHGLMLERFSS